MPPPDFATPWLNVKEAAARARVGPKTIYREIRAGRLRAAVVGNRRDYRLLTDWVDDWLIASTTPREIHVLDLRRVAG